MMLTLAALLLATVPLELPITETIDVCEVQTYYDDKGDEVFTQTILMDFNPHTSRYDVRCWWLVKRQEDVPVQGEILRMDGETMRRVRVGWTFRSHGQRDNELDARQHLPTNERRNLSPSMRDARRVLEE